MKTRTAWIATVCLLATSGAALSNPPPAIVPRDEATGFSTIEQRYVYAPPEEGSFRVPLQPGAGPLEVFIRTREMCEGEAHVDVEYSKSDNRVSIRAEFTDLPYKYDYTRSQDISTPWNLHPVSVEDGKWQVWLIGRLFNLDMLFYYDAATGELLGSAFDYPEPPPFSIPVVLPISHLLCSPVFEGEPDGHAVLEWEMPYDAMIDSEGTGGTWAGFIPQNLCKPDKLVAYYTNGGIPPEEAMTFDDVLATVHRSGIMLATSLEPDPKPEYLKARDNLMIAHIGAYPQTIPQGYTMDLNSGTLQPLEPDTCTSSVELPDWGGPYYDICGGAQ